MKVTSYNSVYRFESLKLQKLDIPLPEMDTMAPMSATVSFPSTQKSVAFDLKANTSAPFPVIPFKGNVPHISPETMCKILSGSYKERFESVHIIDCRFNYEHEGGHIKGSLNCNDPAFLKEKFFKDPMEKALVIFHCEFSQNRGPEVASIFRSIDRKMNKECYPKLFYPNVYVLHGGYKDFYNKYPEWCDGGYTKMVNIDARTNGDLVRGNSQYNENIKKAKEDIELEPEPEIKRRNSCHSSDPKHHNDPVSPIIRHNYSRFDSRINVFDIPF
ncbi:Rhodanese-like domain containing protein [Tritrichomonas foetus]|uniref:protein-tyrosine-phosphatase n=1 Tax=Tritrichomonas foetus TaxID=1144522 RepID=A0A1J4K386_9EUKA|nr:Rhodanese-like domain containing protein [Tritrichomonas foetus]|eukprot:OHT05905.1 Rhodanese-like domain containing protein [Tritrichomonas foetus]